MHKIGILGAAGIAPRSIIQPVRRRDDCCIHAVASRRRAAAKEYARLHGITKAYAGYDELLADPDITIVYNALPPAAHAEWSIKALKAGKHVLCEKPLAMTAAEAEVMVEAAEGAGRVLAEAFHDRYHPVFLHLLAHKRSGALGEIHALRAEFHVDIPFDPHNIRHDPAQGGGAMMDLGCYPLHWLRSFMGEEPEILSAQAKLTPLNVDQRMEVKMRFGGGVDAQLVADIASPPFRGLLRIEGEKGVVELDNPCLPHKGHSIREWFGGSYREFTLAAGTTYDYQLAAFVDAVENGSPLPTGGEDAIGNMRALDEIYVASGLRAPQADRS
ncbi:MAG: Gfo/Idh/MocA family oxidoreductase [Alphaproteobacteria bacterium]|jgi:predicted dehydrogenase|nr:Gfo/Idh/MocA family oxidoreductase [Alphaproteobacteria bacterium]MBU1553137.1 Gfo/Idh/MocA family oxidoreductase [Alphaproteobacteria bacterium]MBU2338112.1 Gfo/Idh/MocA family oxidoreductase [Alphaproteobacteria bacterium]MBU2386665.1 Gfo/Idh/MocA family oxidoreductase [Alphaproteobacteria bacterium]